MNSGNTGSTGSSCIASSGAAINGSSFNPNNNHNNNNNHNDNIRRLSLGNQHPQQQSVNDASNVPAVVQTPSTFGGSANNSHHSHPQYKRPSFNSNINHNSNNNNHDKNRRLSLGHHRPQQQSVINTSNVPAGGQTPSTFGGSGNKNHHINPQHKRPPLGNIAPNPEFAPKRPKQQHRNPYQQSYSASRKSI